MKTMRRCCHCERRIWPWQKAVMWYLRYKNGVWRHVTCRAAYNEGYALARERHDKNPYKGGEEWK